jgi:hypothetical protein
VSTVNLLVGNSPNRCIGDLGGAAFRSSAADNTSPLFAIDVLG